MGTCKQEVGQSSYLSPVYSDSPIGPLYYLFQLPCLGCSPQQVQPSALPLPGLVLTNPVTPGLWQPERGHFPISVSTARLWGCFVPRPSTGSMKYPPKRTSKLTPGSQSTALKASFLTCLPEATRLRVHLRWPRQYDSRKLCNPSVFTLGAPPPPLKDLGRMW